MLINCQGLEISLEEQQSTLLLANDIDIFEVDLAGVERVSLHFPTFTDGRAYSQARTLRRLGFDGDIRAEGDVLVDQLMQMRRCGFTSFRLKKETPLETVVRALKPFTFVYQHAEDEAIPLWRRARVDQKARAAS